MDRNKLLTIFGGAWVSAALLTWLLYSATKAPKVEKTAPIVAAAHDMPAGTRLRKDDLKIVRVSEKDSPKGGMADDKQMLDRTLLFPVTANEPITLAKISSVGGAEGLPSTIEPGKRAISVPINDTSGVSGLIQPRAHVDVLFTKPGSVNEAVTTTILEDVVVLAIGRTTESTSAATVVPTGTAATTAARPNAQSATLLVTPEQARVIELAKNQGKISLALRNPLDHGVADKGATTSQALLNGFVPKDARPGAAPPKPPEPPKVVERVVEKKETPKKVVEVFRGDKHVQESF
jgi:pilus assembly protein CpaB